MCTEDSPSGLWRTLGKRVGCKPSGVRIPHPPPPNPGTVSGSGVFVAFTWNFVVFVSKDCVVPMGCFPVNSQRVFLDRGKLGELSTKLVRQPVGCPRVVGSAGVPGAGGPGRPRDRHTRACGSEWSISKPARALRTLRRPPHRRHLGASSRCPARPRRRPPALRQLPLAPSTPAAPARRVVRRVVSKPGRASPPPTSTAARPCLDAAHRRRGKLEVCSPVVMRYASSQLRARGENVYAGGRSSA